MEQQSNSGTNSLRKPLLTLVAVALLAVGVLTFVVSRSNQASTDIDPEIVAVSYPILIPELCRALVAADSGDRTGTYNAFYQQAHPGLHVLAADVRKRGARGRQIWSVLQRSKSKVEADVVTFPPGLVEDLTSLITVTGDALQEVDFSGEKTC